MGTGLLISRLPVRVHELGCVYTFVRRQGRATFADVVQRFAPYATDTPLSASNLTRELLGFLTTVGLIESSGDLRWEDRVFESKPSDMDFGLLLLSHMRTLDDPRQRALLGVHDSLISAGITHATTQGIVELMESGQFADCFAWNTAKVLFATRLLTDLGLLVYAQPARVAVSTSSNLLLSAIPPGTHALRPLLRDIDSSLFSVFTDLGDVHPGVSHALLRIARRGAFHLGYESDSPESVLLAGTRISYLERRL